MYKVNRALDRIDLFDVELLYIDKTSFKNGYSYTILVYVQDRRIIYVCERNNSETMDRLAV